MHDLYHKSVLASSDDLFKLHVPREHSWQASHVKVVLLLSEEGACLMVQAVEY